MWNLFGSFTEPFNWTLNLIFRLLTTIAVVVVVVVTFNKYNPELLIEKQIGMISDICSQMANFYIPGQHWNSGLDLKCAQKRMFSPPLALFEFKEIFLSKLFKSWQTHILKMQWTVFLNGCIIALCVWNMCNFTGPLCISYNITLSSSLLLALSGLQGCKNGAAPFPGQILQKVSKPGSLCPLL